MSDITLITVSDLVMMALVAGAPGAVLGALIAVFGLRARRAPGIIVGGLVGFVLFLAAVIMVLFIVSN